MKVFHESPICMMHLLKPHTDGEYILPHLLDKFPKYRDYMIQAKQDGRYIIMDNSLHELGQAYSTDRLLHWIEELRPNEFIVPDSWEDPSENLSLAFTWSKIDLPQGVEKMAVVQFQCIEDAYHSYGQIKEMGYKKIAFSYGASFYKEYYSQVNQEMYGSLARVNTILRMIKKGVIGPHDRIHLLGCFVPQEFIWFNGVKQIESIDTSNPIMAGINDIRYHQFGLSKKPTASIDEVIDIDEHVLALSLGNIMYNVEQFKIINRL